MAEGDVVRTVFQTEWLGGNVLSRMIRQYGLAEKALQALGKQQQARSMGARGFGVAMESGASSVEQMTAKLWASGESYDAASAKAKEYVTGVDAASEASKGLLGSLGPLTIALGASVGAILAAAAAWKTLYPVMQQGAEVAQLDASFDHLINTMTDYPHVLNDMKEASKFTVSTMAAQEGIMTLVAGSSRQMTEELTAAAPKLLEISKAANKLNPALGDTNFMFTSLAKGVKRAEPRLIDNLGLKLRVSDANRQLAEELDKSVMALTAEEKQLAILNETLRAGDALIAQVGGSVDGLTDPFQRAEAAAMDFGTSFKQLMFLMFGPRENGMLDAYSTRLRSIAGIQEYQATILTAQRKGAITTAEANNMLAGSLDRDTEAMKTNIELIKQRTQELEEQKAAAEALEAAFEMANPQDERWLMPGPMPFQAPQITAGELIDEGGKVFERELDRMKQANAQMRVEKRALEQAMDLEAVREWGEGFVRAGEAREKTLAEDKKLLDKWAKDTMKASRDAHAAWEEYVSGIGDITAKHVEAEAEASFFSTAIQNIGEGFRVSGGATEEQTEELERLTGKLERARVKLSDMEMGLGQFGRKEEAIAKSHGKLVSDIAILEEAIGNLAIAEEEAVAVHQAAIWNWDNIRKAMGESAEAADLTASSYLRYKQAVGDITEEQARAAISAAALENAIERAFRMVETKELEPEDVESYVQNFQRRIDNADFSAAITPTYDPEAAWEAMNAAQREVELRQREGDKMMFIPEIDEKTAKQQLDEQFFGEEALEPAIIDIDVETDYATTQITAWKQGIEEDPIILSVKLGGAGASIAGGALPLAGLIEGHAYGGSIRGGHAVLVGENEPEVLVPPGNRDVVPASKLGGPPQINLSVHVEGNIGQDEFLTIVEDRLLEAMQQYGL